jgi:hypothetical protein
MSQVLPPEPRSADFLNPLWHLRAQIIGSSPGRIRPIPSDLKADISNLLAAIVYGGNVGREGKELPDLTETPEHCAAVWTIVMNVVGVNPELRSLLKRGDGHLAYVENGADLFTSYLETFRKMCDPVARMEVAAEELESFKKFIDAFYYAAAIDAEKRHFEEGGGES